ncbi:MAG: hypothetical protein GY826_09165 [Fuerstiella sp.]|nr:hypothetical protein [Fuerstiella sp.]
MEIDRQKAAQNPAATGEAGDTEVDREANYKEASAMFAGMSSEASGSMLREMANNGRIDDVVEILAQLEERDSAGILEAMNDEKLAGEILQKYLARKRPVKMATKRR